MPNLLVFVRHGHSEGNFVNESSKLGDNTFYTPEFRERPGHQWRLTKQGREQAKTAGAWIKNEIGDKFDKYYVSPYVRTKETAALLGMPDAKWRISQRLRERDWGDIGSMPKSEFFDGFPRNALMKRIDGIYWRPPGGESIADVRCRFRDFLDTLHREADGQRVLVVTHGEFMWAARAELECMTDEEWIKADNDPSQKIHNTQIIQYSRIDPKTNNRGDYSNWTSSVNPAEATKNTDWNLIKRTQFSNKDLLSQVELVKPVVNSH